MPQLRKGNDRSEDKQEEITEDVPMSTGDPVMLAGVMSVLFSFYLFYMKGNKMRGIFVGLWAPTLFGASTYLQQKEIKAKFEGGLSFG